VGASVSSSRLHAQEEKRSSQTKVVSRSDAGVVIVGSSFLFSVLQSVCTAVATINGVRLALGLGSLAMTVGLGAELDRFHEITWLRLVLLIGAVLGSTLTLGVQVQAWRLRNRAAAQWRRQPRSRKQRRMDTFQVSLSIVTLLLVVVEEHLHFRWSHTL